MPAPSSPEKRAEWEQKIRLQKESGLSIERWCRDHQISSALYHYWKLRLFPKKPLLRSSFIEPSNPGKTGITLECKGILIHLDKHFEPKVLEQCLAALKAASCL